MKTSNRKFPSYKIVILFFGPLIMFCAYSFHGPRHYLPSESFVHNPITIVTGYFPLTKSKHSLKEYDIWIDNFLSKIQTPMIIYTSTSMVSQLSKLRNGSNTVFQAYEDVWKLPPLFKLKNVYTLQHTIDPENAIHNPGLYAVWNSKPWMLLNAATKLGNPFNSTYLFWVDIGCFRDAKHPFRIWPDLAKVQEVFDRKNSSNSNPHVFANQGVGNIAKKSYGQLSKEVYAVIIGGFFGGRVAAVKWWSDTFYKVHDLMLSKNYFVGKEQNLMTLVATEFSDELLVTCRCDQKVWGGCGNPWLYFQNWYARKEERMSGCEVSAGVRNMTSFINETSVV